VGWDLSSVVDAGVVPNLHLHLEVLADGAAALEKAPAVVLMAPLRHFLR